MEVDAAAGKLFIIAPSEPVTVKRFEGDMEKLVALYWLGYNDMQYNLDALRAWLDKGPCSGFSVSERTATCK